MARRLLFWLLILFTGHITFVFVVVEGEPVREWIRLNHLGFATAETVVCGVTVAICAIILNLRRGSRALNVVSGVAGVVSALGILWLLGSFF